MSSDLVSDGQIFVQYSGGNINCQRITDFSDTEKSKTETVPAIGVWDGAAGFRDSNDGGDISIESLRERVPEVPWRDIKKRKEQIVITTQDRGGERYQYRGVRVSEISRKTDDKGMNIDSVKLVYLRRVQLPTPPVTL